MATNDEANVIHATTATEETLKDLLDGTGIETDKNTQYYVNYGWCEDGATEAVSLINMFPNKQLDENNGYYSLNGVDVEVIDNNDDGTAEYVLYTVETLSEVSRYSEKNETISFYQPTLTNKGLPTGDAETTTRDFDDVVFEGEVAVDDLILYVEYGGRTYVKLAEIVTDMMNRVDRDRNNELYITLDNGEEYRQSYIPDAASMVDVDLTHFDIDNAKKDIGFDTLYDFVLDSAGYVVAVRPAEEVVTNYALVLGSAWTQNALTKSGEITVLMADGTEGTYDINWKKSQDAFENVVAINGVTKYTVKGTDINIENDLDNEERLELYLGSRDVYNEAGMYDVNAAASSVITYSLNDDKTVLTIESVLQDNQFTQKDNSLEIANNVNTKTTAGVGDGGWVVYISNNAKYQNLQYEVGREETNGDFTNGYENRDGTLWVNGAEASGARDTVDKDYAVDLDTVAFYYWVDTANKDKVYYGVATGWDDMSNVKEGTKAQVYPALEKTTDRTYVATNLADLVLFNTPVDTDSDDYMLVLDANAARRGDMWELTVVFEDGTVAAIDVADDDLGDFKPEDPDDDYYFMQAWSYSENSDGTYTVGHRAEDEGRGTAVNYRNRTISFLKDGKLNSQYISLATDANIWNVTDVEHEGDETVAGNFTNTRVNAVLIMDNGSIRTAWIWDIPQKPDEGVDFDTDTVLVDVIVDGKDPAKRTISIEYIGEEPSASDLRTLITNELLSYYSKAVNGESTKVEITRFNDRTQEVTAEVTKTNEGVSTEKWTYTFVNDTAQAAGEYEYDDGFEYSGSFVVNGNEIIADYSEAEAGTTATDAMNDLARFLGGLHRASGATQIVYDGVEYAWDDDALNHDGNPVAGSCWYDAKDSGYNGTIGSQNTLVSAITTDVVANSLTSITLVVDGVEMTISFNLPA